MNHNKTILIDGVRYHKDRPASCRQCYFWKNRKVGCTLGKENCYYLAESPKKKSPCEGCCYGPCVSSKAEPLQEAPGHAAEGRPEQGTAEVPVLPVFPARVPVSEVPVCDLSLRKGPQYRVPEKAP